MVGNIHRQSREETMEDPEQTGLVPADEALYALHSILNTGACTRKGGKPVGWTPLLVLAALVGTIGAALPVGYNIGVMNSPDRIIKDFCNGSVEAHYGSALSSSQMEVLWSVIVSIFLVGGMVGSLSGGWVADRFGRKNGIGISLLVCTAAAVLFVCSKYANSVEMLLLGRVVVGLSSGLATSIVPMYLTEIAPLHLRGALGVCCPLGVTFGVLVAQIFGLDWVLGTECCWHLLLGLFGPLSLIGLLLTPALPESPKFLYLVRGEEALGVRELSRLRKLPEERLAGEVRALRLAQKAEREQAVGAGAGAGPGSGAWTARRVLTSPELRLPLVLVCALQAGQQLSCISGIFYYSNSVFLKAGLSQTAAQYASLGAGVVNFGVAALAVPLVNNCGRRPLILLSTSTAFVFIVLQGASLTFIDLYPWMPYIVVISLLLFVFFYGLGMGPIPYFIGAELFDVGPRPVGMAIGSMANWGGNFLVGMAFSPMQSAMGASSFYIFAVFIFLQSLLYKLYFPETKGRDSAEIADMLKLGFKSKVAMDVPLPSLSNNSNGSPDNPSNTFAENRDV